MTAPSTRQEQRLETCSKPSERVLNGGADRREEEAGAKALHDPGCDDLAWALGDPARDTGQGEDGEPEQEQSLVAETVTGAAAGHQRESVRQGVARHDPLQAGRGRVQTGPDARQRDVHDRGIQQRHEGADQDD